MEWLRETLSPPPPLLFADLCHSWVIIFHPYKRATGIRSRIRLTAKVLDNSFTSAVSGRGQVERTSLLFTTKESQLSKGHIRSEFFHSASAKNNVPSLVETNFIVGPPEGGLNRWGVLKNIGNKKPRPLKAKEILSIIPLVLFNHSSFSVFLSLFLYFKYEKWQRRDVFSNSIEMAIFKIKIGLWKNTFFQFSEISGYVCPSILYAHDAIAKKNVSMNRRKKKFSFTQTNHKLFSPW